MIGRHWFQPPRRVLTIFVVLVVACVIALAWLGYRLLRQDHALESQRVQEQLEVAADRVVSRLGSGLELLHPAPLPPGVVLLVADATTLDVRGGPRLIFQPGTMLPLEAPPPSIVAGEVLEFQKNDPLAAAALFREVARSPEPAVRAAALVRLGRSLRKAGRTQDAMKAYPSWQQWAPLPSRGCPRN